MPSKNIFLCISTPNKTLFEGEAEKIIIRGTEGKATLLAGHHSSIFGLEAGDVLVKTHEEEIIFRIKKGRLLFDGNSALLISPFAALAEEYDKQARMHLEELEERYSQEVKSEFDLQRIQMALQRTLMKKS